MEFIIIKKKGGFYDIDVDDDYQPIGGFSTLSKSLINDLESYNQNKKEFNNFKNRYELEKVVQKFISNY